jgi:Xaa-Pro aminopeptidase
MKLKNAFLKNRLRALQKRLTSWRVPACIVENPIDLFYLLGLKISAGTLLLTQEEAFLLVDGRYLQCAREKDFFRTLALDEKTLSHLIREQKIKTLAFDSWTTSVDRAEDLKRLGKLKGISRLLKEERLLKDPLEIRALKKSAHLLEKGFAHIKNSLKEGISEKELALSFELFCRQRGADTLAFEPIIAFGANSAMPHHRAGQTRLKKGDLVLIDSGVIYENYHSDMTRVLFFDAPNSEFKKLYALVKKAQRAALRLCKPGQKVGSLDRAAREVMKKENVETSFLHSLGHGIGLETHEYPKIKEGGLDSTLRLEPGMVITLEPGLYFPGRGGVRYEDMILITEKGYQKITHSSIP